MKKFKFTYTQALAGLMLALLVLSLMPIFYASFYCHPILDDFNFSCGVRSAVVAGEGIVGMLKGSFEKVAHIYKTWQGTFAAVFLFSFQPAVFGEDLYFLTTFVMVFSLCLSTFFLIDTILVKCFKAERSYSVLITAALLFCTYQFLVDIPQGLFWWNGSVYYTVFHAFALCMFTLLIRMYVAESAMKRNICFAFALILAFMVGGGNYSTALFSFCLMVLALFFLTRQRAEKLWQYYVVFGVLVLCFAINAAAPGNAVRASRGVGLGPVEAIIRSVYEAAVCIGGWSGPAQLSLFIFVTPFLYDIARRQSFKFRYPLAVLLLSFLCFATLLTPPLFAISHTGAGRQQNMYYYNYYLLVLLNIFYICGWLAKRAKRDFDIAKLWRVKVLVPAALLLTLLFGFGCYLYDFEDLSSVKVYNAIASGELWQYEQEYMGLVERVKNGENELSDVRTCPKDVFLRLELEQYWVHEWMARYYGVDIFTVKPLD